MSDETAIGVAAPVSPEFSHAPEVPSADVPIAVNPVSAGLPGYTVVRLPDGSVHAIPDSAVIDAGAANAQAVTAVSEAKAYVPADAVEELYYVWLANGQVRKVKESDLPPIAGTNAPFGLWVEDGKTYVVTGVYPVEHPR